MAKEGGGDAEAVDEAAGGLVEGGGAGREIRGEVGGGLGDVEADADHDVAVPGGRPPAGGGGPGGGGATFDEDAGEFSAAGEDVRFVG